MTTKHIFIAGPAQSGKTEAAMAVANAMHDKNRATIFLAANDYKASVIREFGGLRCKIGTHAAGLALQAWSCIVVDDAERVSGLRAFAALAIQRQIAQRFATVVWVVSDEHAERVRKAVAEMSGARVVLIDDVDAFPAADITEPIDLPPGAVAGFNASAMQRVRRALETRDFSGVTIEELRMFGGWTSPRSDEGASNAAFGVLDAASEVIDAATDEVIAGILVGAEAIVREYGRAAIDAARSLRVYGFSDGSADQNSVLSEFRARCDAIRQAWIVRAK